MNHRLLFILVCLAAYLLALPSHAQVFECAFLQDKYASGKSNKASCSMLPQKVFSKKGNTPKKSEHCNIEKIYLYEDIEDVLINTKTGVITWTIQEGLTADAKKILKQKYIKDGFSEEQADKEINSINSERELREHFEIKSHYVSEQEIWLDEVTGKVLKSKRRVPEHNLMFTDGISIYYMYIPEFSGHAILFKPTGMANSSWVNMSFGKCRMNP